jgi:hypothetical protein
MTDPTLSAGGVFTSDVSGELTFYGLTTLMLNNTTNDFITGMSVQGYIPAGEWNPIPGANIGPGKVYYSISAVNSVTFRGLELGNINGANTAVKPSFGPAANFLVTIAINYE